MGIYIQIDYTNVEGEAFKIEVSDATYSGVIYQVQGKGVLEYPKVKTMDMVRGSALKMQLEASTSDVWIDRLISTVGDKKLPVTLYKDGSVIWNGFIKPDGIVQSYVSDYYYVQIQAIDGLGLLENIKFLNSDGDIYQGAMSEIDILTRCLELTGLSMQFRIYYINLFFSVDGSDPTVSQQALEDTYVNADRYVKKDDASSVFTAKEVLEALLKKYGCFICQQNNLWHIVRIIDFYTDYGSQPYALYDADGTFVNDYSASPDLNEELGSQIDGYYPHHAGGNQQKTYKAALGAYKVYYEFGTVNSILENPKIYFNDGAGDIDGWIVEGSLSNFTFTLQDAISGWPSGYYQAALEVQTSSLEALSYDYTTYDNDVEQDDTLKVVIELDVNYNLYTVSLAPAIISQYAMITLIGDGGSTYYLNQSGEWTLSSATCNMYKYKWKWNPSAEGTHKTTFTINTNGCPDDGTINILFYFPIISGSYTDYGSTAVINNVAINQADNGIKGESFTAQRNYEGNGTATAIVDLEDKIYVGDNESDTYIGAIEDSSAENTVRWSKRDGIGGAIDSTKQFKLLDWLARDRMTISGGNSLIFKGGVYGYLPYLSVVTINNITGIFQTISWKYDTEANKIEAEYERIFTDDIYSDVSVSYQLESDNVVKPAIE